MIYQGVRYLLYDKSILQKEKFILYKFYYYQLLLMVLKCGHWIRENRAGGIDEVLKDKYEESTSDWVRNEDVRKNLHEES